MQKISNLGNKVPKKGPKEDLLDMLKKAGDKNGITVYQAAKKGKYSQSQVSNAFEDFKEAGLVTRDTDIDDTDTEHQRQPYKITPLGERVFDVVVEIAKCNSIGEPTTIGRLRQKFPTEIINKAVVACIFRYRIPKSDYWDVVCQLSRIDLLQIEPSDVVSKKSVVIK